MEKVFTVKNPTGLHARPAAKLAQTANSYPCDIYLVKDGKQINAKSVMGLMALAAKQGEQLTVITSGEKEAEALEAVGAVIETIFE
ncbi:HPr family phosphocarrier protein [Brevibacillus sp. SYP-B805]|jgi:phosphocarrier protein HPr|uniref:HPr family phosphocarrier protein n=1 Tax=Brevibacillus sp. SYP-B805 TaxID=1578199 RepID=UPI0013ECDD58|nr:HPr family phosphocarrier protein [Brevibacillus sp. SYP-B805]NGQ95259.1 HPr family phosphocarrier protein [Brevibacillus sp. SYP-B805]